MYFDLSSEVNLNLTYYIIAASNDYPMYNIEDNSVISGVIPGYSKDELVTYGAYVRLVFLLDHRLQGALILEELSMQSTSRSTVTPFLRRPSEPLCRNTPLRRKSVPYSIFRSAVRRSLTRDGNKLYASMSRSHYLFCMACTRYVISLCSFAMCRSTSAPTLWATRTSTSRWTSTWTEASKSWR